MTLLELQEINTYYGKSHVLFDVSFSIGKGKITALIGRNGAGKTTVINTIMGLTPASSGKILLKDEEITDKKTYEIAKAGIGLIPEERWIFPNLSVHENLIMGIKPGKMGKNVSGEWTFERVYEHFPNLAKLRRRKGGFLSGGEKQLLSIARILMGNPDILLIDEPMEGLAPIIIDQVVNTISYINALGKTILLVEQKPQIIQKLAHRIYILCKGAIKWTGIPEELNDRKDIRKKYLEV